jgi:AraC family transcriptional regulator
MPTTVGQGQRDQASRPVSECEPIAHLSFGQQLGRWIRLPGSPAQTHVLPRTAPGDLVYPPRNMVRHDVIEAIVRALLPGLEHHENMGELLAGHLVVAFAEHQVTTYCVPPAQLSMHPSGLAPWQQRRAEEMLRGHLSDGITVGALATACRLSPSAFIRAFKKSTGLPPHRWLLARRIELAMNLLHDRELPLAQIALSAGFSDQSHLTRAFRARVGVGPGAWRRAHTAATCSLELCRLA